MQLCFVWVSSFRNFENQGFNLGAKFELSFSHPSGQLSIKKNKKYIVDFFSPEIRNVTGIVGENAAGKTNLLEMINYMMDGGNTRIASPFIIVFEEQGKFVIYNFQVARIEANAPFEVLPYSDNKVPVETIFFTNIFDGRMHDFGKNIYDLSSNRILQNQFRENTQTQLKKEVNEQIRFLQSPLFREMENLEISHYSNARLEIKPTHVQFTSPAWENINGRARSFDRMVSNSIGKKFTELVEFCQNYRKKITDNFSEKSFIYFTGFLLFMDFLSNEFMPESHLFRGKDGFSTAPEKLIDELREIDIQNLSELRINEIHDAITGRIAIFIDKHYPYTFEKTKFLHDLHLFNFPELEKLSEGTYSNRKFQFRAKFSIEVERFIKKYTEATTKLNLNYAIEWLGMSSGQKAFLNIFSRMYSISGDLRKQSLLITIDEGDLYFHPRWQVEYLSRILHFLPLIFKGRIIQLVLTTHSPFLVSDLTKNHLIFLRKNTDGFVEIVPAGDIASETFGGNIGELYLNAFFLDGNLVSNFAADKIKRLISIIKEKPSNKSQQDQLLIDQLGDDLIKYQINKLLNGAIK